MRYPALLDALARLHTDSSFRRAFLADPAAALAPLGLDEGDARALTRLDPGRVRVIGAVAEQHREARVQEHIPWASRALRPDLGPVLEGYFASEPPRLLNREEALAFCEYVERAPPVAPAPAYLPDLCRYERLRISVAWELPGYAGEPRMETFAYPILPILAALGSPGWPEAAPAPALVTFKKAPGIPATIVRG